MRENKVSFGGFQSKFSNYENSKVTVVPVPFDKTSSWLKGSKKGPGAIIDASLHLEFYDIETDSEVYKKGIFTSKEILAKTSIEMVNKVFRRVKNLLTDKKFTVTLGGEHTVSVGAIKAHADFYGNITVLHLDAHSDMRSSYQGSKYSHACVMARVREIVDNTVSVGIRSMDSSELGNIKKSAIFYAAEIYKSSKWIGRILKKLSGNVYVTIDLDVFDPSIIPSTGTPEPGGLSWYQVIGLLKSVSEQKNIIGFDVVELCPSKNRAPDFLAAKLVYKLLSYKFATKN